MEYRIIPRWNPFEHLPWIQEKVGVKWIQLVVFAEEGRVAPTWQFQQWSSALKWDAGVALRFQA